MKDYPVFKAAEPLDQLTAFMEYSKEKEKSDKENAKKKGLK